MGDPEKPGKADEIDFIDDEVQQFGKDENTERGNWTGRFEFLLSCLGYAVGLGNVWRFPYLCYKNGGAVFFIPYCIALFFVGMPIFFLELSLGQFSSSGATMCWTFAPIFKGIGWAMVIVSGLVAIYYNMIIAWSLYYFVASWVDIGKGDHVPWDWCNPDWASPFCETRLSENMTMANCTGSNYVVEHGLCKSWYGADGITNGTIYAILDKDVAKSAGYVKRSKAEDYLYSRVLKTGPQGNGNGYNMDNMGELQWDLCLCLLGAWVIVCLSLIKGIKSSGKVVYFTALFPYVVLIALLIRGLLLDGYYKGIEFYILKVDLEKLKDVEVWKEATVQIFFSLSASWGGLIALSSYNRFHNDCLRDSLIISLGNCLTSFFAGFVIFSYLGYLSEQLGVEVKDVAKDGVGLAFTIYTTAVTTIPGSPFWALLFFLMLITLGLDSEFALVETVVTSIQDEFPSLRKKKSVVVIVVCVILFFCGLPLCMNGGEKLLSLMDDYSGGWNVLLIAVLECVAIGWFYGTYDFIAGPQGGRAGFFRFAEDIRIMLGHKNVTSCLWPCFRYWWMLCWCLISPALCLLLVVYSWYDYNEKIAVKKVAYGNGGQWYLLGWAFTMSVIIAIILTCIYTIGKYSRRLVDIIRPTQTWGPALEKHRRLVTYVPGFVVDPNEELLVSNGKGPKKEHEVYDNVAYENSRM